MYGGVNRVPSHDRDHDRDHAHHQEYRAPVADVPASTPLRYHDATPLPYGGSEATGGAIYDESPPSDMPSSYRSNGPRTVDRAETGASGDGVRGVDNDISGQYDNSLLLRRHYATTLPRHASREATPPGHAHALYADEEGGTPPPPRSETAPHIVGYVAASNRTPSLTTDAEMRYLDDDVTERVKIVDQRGWLQSRDESDQEYNPAPLLS